MTNFKVWEIDFDVIGPISIVNNINFRQEKGFEQQQFYSDISLRKSNYGLRATITAYADTLHIAETVAFVYFGRMRDVLSLENDIPIQINKIKKDYYRPKGSFNNFRYNNQEVYRSRRLLDKSDIISAFKMAREFEVNQPKLLRAIGWYSKGKISENTFDQFLAFWSVIEILGKEFHTETERTSIGVKNKIYQCFIDYFGDINTWELPDQWIDQMHDRRSNLVHGGEDYTIEAINGISELIPLLEHTSKKLIDKIIDTTYNRQDFIHFDF
ncbi:methylamine utilization protein MauJ [Jeotgalibacillus salarius]|uniref:Uncharacterized protein n=1 Tax=Jeotgalibacillus salarius TaxID=546023 RepID=A0A4Y8LEB6_9BACL|nr:methylamine utilization protein MauJ [Jeotgalibacillus salarius]TFE00666.1 hypothetical protein E2626_11885 [Jeotgalibacillus salarius]